MRLKDLIEGLPVRVQTGSGDLVVRALRDDSRRVGAGEVFVARLGSETDGRKYVEDAISRGAAGVVVVEVAGALPEMARRFYDDPGSKLKMIGITGTNGKTTTAYWVHHILRAAGVRCGMIGTVEVDDGREARPAELTTPGLFDLYELLARMVKNGCGACVMEVSSHALAQDRVGGVVFEVGVFTNLTGDHLDYHKTMEAYGDAKARLFESLGAGATAVVNADDPAAERMLRGCVARRLMFGGSEGVDCRVTVREISAAGTVCELEGPWGKLELKVSQIGRHNAWNAAAAVASVHAMGVDVRGLRGAIESFAGAPGRLERVQRSEVRGQRSGPEFEVFVDYAHTDDALANVLRALRPVTTGRLRVMFGCGGDRDATKRARMARVACELADDVTVTSDNPRTEEPMGIIQQILAGVPDSMRGAVAVEPDRARAIEKVLHEAGRGDVVLLAGKGHEDYQIIGKTKRPFDDRAVARGVLERMGAGNSDLKFQISDLKTR